jgi:hypothetical protein
VSLLGEASSCSAPMAQCIRPQYRVSRIVYRVALIALTALIAAACGVTAPAHYANTQSKQPLLSTVLHAPSAFILLDCACSRRVQQVKAWAELAGACRAGRYCVAASGHRTITVKRLEHCNPLYCSQCWVAYIRIRGRGVLPN